ncbi:MAG: GNAT family N-acetyltransferase [Candidatus Dormibacteria bacterium]
MTVEVRQVGADAVPLFLRGFDLGFGESDPDDLDSFRRRMEASLPLVATRDGETAGIAGVEPLTLTVPGGEVACSGVTWVTVWPTHRRRGVLTAMMRRMLELGREHEHPVAALWASESRIYGRFGYGVAAREVSYHGKRSALSLRRGLSSGERLRLLETDEARRVLPPLYEDLRRLTPGMLQRPGQFWDQILADHPGSRHGWSALRVVVADQGGEARGYCGYRMKLEESGALLHGEVAVRDLFAHDPGTLAALWEHIVSVDLTDRVRVHRRPVDDPLWWMLEDPRHLVPTLSDGLWLRLSAVDRALAARAYSRPGVLRLELHDSFCDWAAGTWRLEAGDGGARCVRVEGPGDIALGAEELGAAYLGGASLQMLARAGRVEERTPGALPLADAMFGWDRSPLCDHVF